MVSRHTTCPDTGKHPETLLFHSILTCHMEVILRLMLSRHFMSGHQHAANPRYFSTFWLAVWGNPSLMQSHHSICLDNIMHPESSLVLNMLACYIGVNRSRIILYVRTPAYFQKPFYFQHYGCNPKQMLSLLRPDTSMHADPSLFLSTLARHM